MKKVIIALLLVALFAAPVFAIPLLDFNYGAEITCDFTVAAGKVQFKQAGIFATAKYPLKTVATSSPFFAEGRIGYVTTFKADPAVNGVQIDAMIGNKGTYKVQGAVGLSTDLHIIDEQLTANWAITAEAMSLKEVEQGTTEIEVFVGPAANLRYVFANKTGVAPFSFGVGVITGYREAN